MGLVCEADTRGVKVWSKTKPLQSVSHWVHAGGALTVFYLFFLKNVFYNENQYFSHPLSLKVMTPAHPSTSRAHTLPFRKHPGLLHLESCGDVSTFTTAENRLLQRRSQRVEQERPHSLIGVVRETVL